MEHSYIGNNFVQALEHLMKEKNESHIQIITLDCLP